MKRQRANFLFFSDHGRPNKHPLWIVLQRKSETTKILYTNFYTMKQIFVYKSKISFISVNIGLLNRLKIFYTEHYCIFTFCRMFMFVFQGSSKRHGVYKGTIETQPIEFSKKLQLRNRNKHVTIFIIRFLRKYWTNMFSSRFHSCDLLSALCAFDLL